MRTLGVITARAGSKGIPGKNLRLLRGKSLIAYTIEAAQQSGAFDRLILSTDDQAIADVARSLGCDVPFMRSAALAQDDTPHLPVMQHAVGWLREHQGYEADAVMILQPTSPLRRPEDMRASLNLLERTGADSVVSVSELPSHYHPLRTLRVAPSGDAVLFVTGEPVRRRINRRQEFPPAVVMNGAIYVFLPHLLFDVDPSLYGNRAVAYPLPEPYGLSIDEPEDWVAAERALSAIAARATVG